MSSIYTVENVISNFDLNKLYNNLIKSPVWDLSRSSKNSLVGTFPGFEIQNGDQINNIAWSAYFSALLENIKNQFEKKYFFSLPDRIERIHLGAKNSSSFTEFHCDTNNANAYTIVGFLTPEWSKEWEGFLMVEDKKFEFIPGRFIIFKSNMRHNGVSSEKILPYWRVTLNYVIF